MLGWRSHYQSPLPEATAGRRGATSSSCPTGDAAQIAAVAQDVQRCFETAPRSTALAIMDTMSELDRVHLLLALQSTTKKIAAHKLDTEYVDDLLKIGKAKTTHATLTRGEIASAVAYQRMLQRMTYSQNAPTVKQLAAVAMASGLPFLGFGFTDNVVMILAGDAIDSLFGARLGLTTLASAGLGNVVADVVGVSVTQQIKQVSRGVRWAQPPRLSTLQQAMTSTRVAKMGGAAAGVSIGCILGMLPLAFMPPGFFVDGPHAVAKAGAE